MSEHGYERSDDRDVFYTQWLEPSQNRPRPKHPNCITEENDGGEASPGIRVFALS